MSQGGLSKARLSRMQDVMAGYVGRGEVPGIVTLREDAPRHWLGRRSHPTTLPGPLYSCGDARALPHRSPG